MFSLRGWRSPILMAQFEPAWKGGEKFVWAGVPLDMCCCAARCFGSTQNCGRGLVGRRVANDLARCVAMFISWFFSVADRL